MLVLFKVGKVVVEIELEDCRSVVAQDLQAGLMGGIKSPPDPLPHTHAPKVRPETISLGCPNLGFPDYPKKVFRDNYSLLFPHIFQLNFKEN